MKAQGRANAGPRAGEETRGSRKAILIVSVFLAGGLVSCARRESSVEAKPSPTPTPKARPAKASPAATPTKAAGPRRLDSEYPLPTLKPAVSEARGIRVADWGYRFTRPGMPDNTLLIQTVVRNERGKKAKVLLVSALEHGVPWSLPQPAWYRVDVRELDLAAGEDRRVTVEFPELQNIHLGIKAGFYIPKVLVKEVGDFNDDSDAIEGVRILEWNYTVVARPRGPHPAKFVALLRNHDGGAKRVTVRTELVPRAGVQGYEGPPQGFQEDHVIQIPEGERLFLEEMPMLSTSGISRQQAGSMFDAGVRIVSVERPAP